MIRCLALSLLLLVPACGGGGGGTVVPATVPVRLTAAPLDLGPATSEVELVVQIDAATTESPVLLQLAIELPPALAFAASDRLLPSANAATLDGELQGNRLVVLCGDAQNPVANVLAKGPLFRVRLVTATPRQVGTHEVRLIELRAAAADGSRLPTDAAPTIVPVTLR